MTEDLDHLEGVPQGSLYTGGLEIVTFLTPDGETGHHVHFPQDMSLITLLGLLKVAEVEILSAVEWVTADEDDD